MFPLASKTPNILYTICHFVGQAFHGSLVFSSTFEVNKSINKLAKILMFIMSIDQIVINPHKIYVKNITESKLLFTMTSNIQITWIILLINYLLWCLFVFSPFYFDNFQKSHEGFSWISVKSGLQREYREREDDTSCDDLSVSGRQSYQSICKLAEDYG